MKRDVDLIRQLMFEIEHQGAECPIEALRNGAHHEHEIAERTRYHLRLLIDAGLAKEIDRTSSGQPCVRLTSAGHEFLDLCRGDERWRQAKWLVHEQTGGLSLAVLRAVLTKWAINGISRSEQHRRSRRSYRPVYEHDYYYGEIAAATGPAYRVDSYRYEREPMFDDEPARLVRPRRNYREAMAPGERWDDPHTDVNQLLAEEPLGVSLPVHMI